MVSERVSQWDEVRQQKEADKGNAHVIAYGSAGKVSSALFYAVIGEKPAQIRIDGESLNVNGIRIPFFRESFRSVTETLFLLISEPGSGSGFHLPPFFTESGR